MGVGLPGAGTGCVVGDFVTVAISHAYGRYSVLWLYLNQLSISQRYSLCTSVDSYRCRPPLVPITVILPMSSVVLNDPVIVLVHDSSVITVRILAIYVVNHWSHVGILGQFTTFFTGPRSRYSELRS